MSTLQPLSLERPEDRDAAHRTYLILAGVFIASLVACNLIFRKFFIWQPFGTDGWLTFEQSVGLLPYPLTFVITDVISEVYGRKKANLVVQAGLVASLFTLVFVAISSASTAAGWSPVTDSQFDHVFGSTVAGVGASMVAYLLAQFLDVRIFHFWKDLTGGKALWLRNNLSTIPSQLVDTATVLAVLCLLGELEWGLFPKLFINGFAFKVVFALLDTPFVYLVCGWLRKRFDLSFGQELAL
jgi:uncharacterized integral membrane protein (TIGR00697 family)